MNIAVRSMGFLLIRYTHIIPRFGKLSSPMLQIISPVIFLDDAALPRCWYNWDQGEHIAMKPQMRWLPSRTACYQAHYQVRVRGYLDPQWAEWFCGMTITHDANGDTVLAGLVVDQAALHGVLTRVRDLGLTLVSVNRMEEVVSMNPQEEA